MVTAIILTCLFFIGIAIIANLLTMKEYSEYIENKTIFYCAENPELICTIESFNFYDIDNQRMEINVVYPSGKKILILTNRLTFEKIWDRF